MCARRIERVLIVEDDPSLLSTLEGLFQERFPLILTCRSVAEVETTVRLSCVDLVLLDVALPDGDAFDVLNVLKNGTPTPEIIAFSGIAQAEVSFELAKQGVRFFLSKPLDLSRLEYAISLAAETPPEISPFIKRSVGHRPIHEIEWEIRETMVNEAMARSSDSRRQAASLLSISRQLLQHILRKIETI